jgi:CHAT domain-containing protein/tetratricopeptide (TPR) repeat protein
MHRQATANSLHSHWQSVARCSTRVAAGLLIASVTWSACHVRQDPQKLFAEGDNLRLKYEKDASHQAIEKYGEAMRTWQRSGDKRGAARAGQQIGATYGQLGSLQKSLQFYQTALSLAQESTDRILESEIRSNVGIAQTYVSEREETFEAAQTQCQVALELARQAAADAAAAKALNCLGEVAYYRQSPEHALEFHRDAGRLWDRAGDKRGQAQTQLFQGYVYSDLSRFDQAEAFFERAHALWTALGDTREQAITLVADARLELRRGEYQDALAKFERALTLLRPMGDAVWEGSCLTGLARVYLDMGETSAALPYWERALEIFDRAGLKNVSIDVLMSSGTAYLASGNDVIALTRFERALATADELGIPRWKAFALRFIGVVHLFRKAPDQARHYFERSLEIQSQAGAGDPRLAARTRADLGEAFDLLGDHRGAAKHFDDALALSTSAGDRVAEARGLFGLARASTGLNELDAARTFIERSLKVAESLRTEVENRDLRASYFASVHQYHEFHMDVLMRLNDVRPGRGLAAAAFEASERARARSLLDSLSVAGVDIRAGVDATLLKREQVLKRAFGDWAKRQRHVGSDVARSADARALADEYRDLEHQYSLVQGEIRSRSPRFADLAQPQPIGLKAVQSQVVDADTLLLEYALGEARSYLWVISNKDHTSHELPPRAEIERAAQRVYERLTTRLTVTGEQSDRNRRIEQADTEYWQEAARLSEMLLGPVAKKIAGKRLLLVTDGSLQYLPFAALPVPGRTDPVPMMVEHEIVYLPSASVLAVLRRETGSRATSYKAVAVFADPVFEPDDPRLRNANPAARRPQLASKGGDSVGAESGATRALRDVGFLRDGTVSVPRLASTRLEADAIVAAAPRGTTWRAIDFDANRETALSSELAKYRIVHFATHGVFNNENPALSGIVLSMFDKHGQAQDGFLRLHDIYELKLPAELVVLSACNTALGKPVRGEGLVGIVRGFMYAGAKRVAASLWKVDDEATGELMGRFYVDMLQKNRSPAAALRQAQLAMWQQTKWQAPFFWAAFVLQGEWK